MLRCCECTLLRNGQFFATPSGQVCEECWSYVQQNPNAAAAAIDIEYEALLLWYKSNGGSTARSDFARWIALMNGRKEAIAWVKLQHKDEWEACLKEAQEANSPALADLEARTKAVLIKVLKYCGINDTDRYIKNNGGVMKTKEHLIKYTWDNDRLKNSGLPEWPV